MPSYRIRSPRREAIAEFGADEWPDESVRGADAAPNST